MKELNVNTFCSVMLLAVCGHHMEYAIKRAIEASGKDIPLEVAVISPNGSIVEIRK